MQWRQWGWNPQPLGLESSTLPLSQFVVFGLNPYSATIYFCLENAVYFLCEGKIIASMLLYASFPLIWYATVPYFEKE